MRIASRTFVGFTVAVLAACASGRGGAVTRSQVDVTIPGAPATASARVLSAFADAQFPAERAEASILAAEVPLTEQDQGGRAGTRVMVQAALIPAATDSTRVVLTGRILVPAAGDLPAQTIPVTSANHPEYGKTNRQGWAAMERIERTLRGRR